MILLRTFLYKEELSKTGLIRPSNSPHKSPTFIVKYRVEILRRKLCIVILTIEE